MSQPAVTHDLPTAVIAVLTYRRPDNLRTVVPAVLAQLPDAPCRASVLVIDNNPEPNADPVVAEIGDQRVRVVHEPIPGIVAARNRALDECAAADVLIFIDDDERPEPGWLRSLVEMWLETGAAAVVGSVIPDYAEEPEPWITVGEFFKRRRLPSGTEVPVAASGNLLLDMAQVQRWGVKFDPRFSASGGSDTLFTRELHRRGGRMVWCDEAVIVDIVPAARLTRRWVLQRSVRTGSAWSRTSLALHASPWGRTGRRITLTGQGLARVAGGAARVAFGVLRRSMWHRARGARTFARGLGMTMGAWGFSYIEYRRSRTPEPDAAPR